MKGKLILLILAVFVTTMVFGQTETYTVRKAAFSSDKYDEFSPVYYKNGIVFCSNKNLGLSSRTTSQNKGLFKICYIDTTAKVDHESVKLFSKNLTSILNDGPVSFNTSGDTIYYSRNQDVTSKLSDISGPRNKLGLFTASLVNGQWTKIRELRINNEWYNITTPCLSPDGKKIFFASDKPGGYGGTDLYYSIWKGDRWEDPVNLGPVINTSGNESYPFINSSGELFFSSDGHSGNGGKDIFLTQYSDSTWSNPICLDPPINSKSDDFGFVTDALMDEGYFSSNRDKSVDIFHFRTNFPQVIYDKPEKENAYCFTFSDSGAISVDTLNLRYVWDFGDGTKASGERVPHCYKGAGVYTVKLNVVERNNGNVFFPKLIYNLEILDYKQPYINSPDLAVKDEVISFDGLKSNLPGYRILNYAWNFRDGERAIGSSVQHSFREKGEFMVNLELTVQSEVTGNVHKTGISKKVIVLNSNQEKVSFIRENTHLKADYPLLSSAKNAIIKVDYSAEAEFRKDAVFYVEILSSRTKLGVENKIFRYIPKKYDIKEKFIAEENAYSYIADQQLNLMYTYQSYKELIDLGYKDTKIKIVLLKDPAEKELHNLIKINGAFADSYFDQSNRLTSNAFIMLDQIVKLMNKYPYLKLEIAVHTDNTGTPEALQTSSQTHAQSLVNYLLNRGINVRRVVASGFGGSKPIAPNVLEKDKKLNRRIDFIILNK